MGSYFGATWFGPASNGSGGAASWYYADEQDVEDLIGARNLDIISNVDPDSIDRDHDRIQRLGEWSDSQIDLVLKGIFATPLTNMDTATTALMADISAMLVADALDLPHALRGDDGNETGKTARTLLENYGERARAMLNNVRLGLASIVADRRWPLESDSPYVAKSA